MGSTWVKLADTFPDHPKVLEVGQEAAWLYVVGLCHCSRHLTDGFISAGTLPHLVTTKHPQRLADRLVEHRLWIVVEGGWTVNDYTKTQRTREQVETQREAARDRMRRARNVPANNERSSAAVTPPERRDAETQITDPPTPQAVSPDSDTPFADYVANALAARAIRDALRRNPLSLVGEAMK